MTKYFGNRLITIQEMLGAKELEFYDYFLAHLNE